jgi:hypothetical protein
MQTWFVQHEFLASWSSAIAAWLAALISLAAMLSQSRRAGVPIKWNSVVLRVGFLLCLGGILSPTTAEGVRVSLGFFGTMLLFAVIRGADRE